MAARALMPIFSAAAAAAAAAAICARLRYSRVGGRR